MATAPGGVVVEFLRGTGRAAMNQLQSASGATLTFTAPRGFGKGTSFAVYRSSTLSTGQLIEKLKGMKGVVAVSPNYSRTPATVPNDPLFGQLWGLRNTGQNGGLTGADIDATQAWDITTGSSDVVVANVDTGVAYAHPDLAANMWKNPGEIPGDGIDNDGNGYVDDVYGIDAYAQDTDPWDEYGHGTHTTGIIAAAGNNGQGVAGVGWQTKVMALRFMDDSGSDAAAIECINYAIDMKSRGVNVVAINASWGGAEFDQVLEDAIAAAGSAGIIFCAAAGNIGQAAQANNDVAPFYPSSYRLPNIISVAASTADDALASYSHHGKITVDLAAPGDNILSTYPGTYVPAAGDAVFDNMEAGPGNWVTSTWAITTEAAVSGTHSWSDSLNGNYADGAETTLTSIPFDISPLAASGAVLGFRVKCSLENGYDYLYVEGSADGGGSWLPLAQLTGSTGASWSTVNVKLPDGLVKSGLQVRFRLKSDPSVNDDGVHLDDVGIAPAARAATGYITMYGTSMATPHVTGTVALLAAAAPSDSLATRIARILSSVDTPAALAGTTVTGGRLNAYAALLTLQRHRVEQSEPSIMYEGSWETVSDAAFSGGSAAQATTTGAAVTIAFQGTMLEWVAQKGPAAGVARVMLDGGTAKTVDLYAAVSLPQQSVWATGPLPAGIHTVHVEWTGKKNALSTGSAINIDAVDVVGSLLAPTPPAVDVGLGGAVLAGRTFSATGSFTDPGTGGETWTATVDYGDGAGPQALALTAAKVFSLTHVYMTKGSYSLTVTVRDNRGASGSATATVDVATSFDSSILGVDRYDTAVKISRAAFPNGFAIGTGAVVLAPGETFQQALCGAPLAKAYGGVTLLTPSSGLRSTVRTEIRRLRPARVFVIGLSSTIRYAVQAALPAGTPVSGIATPTTSVYYMSYLVSQAIHAKIPGLNTAVVTAGNAFPDALSVAPLAAAKGWPILLTPQAASPTPLTYYATQAIRNLGVTRALVVGTRTAIPLPSGSVTYKVGVDRYQTSVLVADYASTQGMAFAHLGMARGDAFPDALAAGPFLARDKGILLLSPLTGLPATVSASIGGHAAAISRVHFFAMIEPVIGQVKALIP
jgi:subtilisin family serine protease